MKKIFKKKDNNTRRGSQDTLQKGRSMSTNKYYRPKNTKPAVNQRTSASKQPRSLTFAQVVNAGIMLTLLVTVFYASTLSTSPAISIQNSAPVYRDKNAYTEFAATYMKSSFMSQSKLLFRSIDFEQAMRQQFPEIDQINAVVPLGGRKLDVNMSLSVPLVIVMNGSQIGVIDSSGALVTSDVDTLLLSNPDKTVPQLRFSTPQDNFISGTVLLTSTEVELLQLITTELQASNLAMNESGSLVVSEFLFNVADGQLEARFTSQPYYAKFSVYGDSRTQVGTMIQTIKQLHSEGQSPTSYIDVRVPGKVYVN